MMLGSAVFPAFGMEKTPSQALIEQLTVSFALYGKRNEAVLNELTAADEALGEKWKQIMDLWKSPVTVREELPDGLPGDDSLCLVVLGFQLNPDGSMRDELIERLKVTLAASEKYPQAVIVCTGGGTAANDPTATEAGKMAEWLKEHGVAPSRILAEERSLTTAQNAVFTLDLLKERCPRVTGIAVITSDYHVPTGALLFSAEAILRNSSVRVLGNAACATATKALPALFQAAALIELSGNMRTAYEIYCRTYDIHAIPPVTEEERPGSDG